MASIETDYVQFTINAECRADFIDSDTFYFYFADTDSIIDNLYNVETDFGYELLDLLNKDEIINFLEEAIQDALSEDQQFWNLVDKYSANNLVFLGEFEIFSEFDRVVRYSSDYFDPGEDDYSESDFRIRNVKILNLEG